MSQKIVFSSESNQILFLNMNDQCYYNQAEDAQNNSENHEYCIAISRCPTGKPDNRVWQMYNDGHRSL